MSSKAPSTESRPVVLLVDDDDDDVRLIIKSLRKDAPNVEILRVDNGMEAVSLLRNEHPYEDSPCPSLVLLDLNMPLMSGREVLQVVKGDKKLASIPIVVLTTSDDEHDITECYANRANSYVTKPVDLSEFREQVSSISQFWFQAATPLPGRNRPATTDSTATL